MNKSIEDFRKTMVNFSDETLKKIVFVDSNDYEPDAVIAAKEELISRNLYPPSHFNNLGSPIPNINEETEKISSNDSYLIFKELISLADTKIVLDNIMNIFPAGNANIETYGKILTQLSTMIPGENKNIQIQININTSNGDFDLNGFDSINHEIFNVEFFSWNDWLSFNIHTNLIEKLTKEKIVACCLLKMTSFGFSDEEILQHLSEIENVGKEIGDVSNSFNQLNNQNLSFDRIISRGIEFRKEINSRESSQIRPWVRFWARFIDSLLWNAIIYVILKHISISVLKLTYLFYPYVSILPISWIIVESILLSTWGTTPGKWLFNISIEDNTRKKLSFSKSFSRSFQVFALGNAGGILYLRFIANIFWYFQLHNKGITFWDNKNQLTVTHKKIGVLRIIIAIIIIITLATFINNF